MANDVKWSTPRDLVEEKPNYQREGRSAMGKSTVIVTCPFCYADVEAYKWSLAGGGKRCVCGALHGWLGGSRRWKPQPDDPVSTSAEKRPDQAGSTGTGNQPNRTQEEK